MSAEPHSLLLLGDAAFCATWRGMSEEEKATLPAHVRSECAERYRKLNGHVMSAPRPAAKLAAVEQMEAAWPAPLDLEALAEREPEPPKFIVQDWLPIGYATLFSGHGGAGKSAIALYLAVCIASGHAFFGLPVERRRVLFLSCEDREPVLHWRLWRICAHLGIDLAGLRGWLEIIDLVGREVVLWERDPRTGATVTPAFAELESRMRDYAAEVLVVDGISDTYAGNENARNEVKRFVNLAVSLIPPDRGAVLLLGHTAKAGDAGYSGSTQWHNAARARWYLYPETVEPDDGGKPQRTGTLILTLEKANLSGAEQSLRFHWDGEAHLFLATESAMIVDRKLQDREESAGILRAFAACQSGGVVIPSAMTGPRTTYHVLSARAEFPATLKGSRGAQTKRFWRLVEELRQSRAIEETDYRRTNRHAGSQFVLTSEGMRQCAV